MADSVVPVSFIVIGAQRAGSTFLADCVSQHPQVNLPHLELPFFDEYFYGRASQHVLRHYYPLGDERLNGLKRPDLLADASAAQRIHENNPHTRILAVLRDPVQRMISAAFLYMYTGRIPVEPVSRIVDRALNNESAERGHWKGGYRDLIDGSMYGAALSEYFERFDPTKLLIQFDQELQDDLQGAMVRTCSFLGLRPVECDASQARQNQSIRSLRRLRLLAKRVRWTFSWDTETEPRIVNTLSRTSAVPFALNGSVHLADRVLLSRWPGPADEGLTARQEDDVKSIFSADIDLLRSMIDVPSEWLSRYSV